MLKEAGDPGNAVAANAMEGMLQGLHKALVFNRQLCVLS